MSDVQKAWEKRLYLRATGWMIYCCPLFDPDECGDVEACGTLEKCKFVKGDIDE